MSRPELTLQLVAYGLTRFDSHSLACVLLYVRIWC